MVRAGSARRALGLGAQPMLLASIWSKSPIPLDSPPPLDHCHISACGLEVVTPPKNCAHVVVSFRHQPVGGEVKVGCLGFVGPLVDVVGDRCGAAGADDRLPHACGGVDAGDVGGVAGEVVSEAVEHGLVDARRDRGGRDLSAARRGVDAWVPAVGPRLLVLAMRLPSLRPWDSPRCPPGKRAVELARLRGGEPAFTAWPPTASHQRTRSRAVMAVAQRLLLPSTASRARQGRCAGAFRSAASVAMVIRRSAAVDHEHGPAKVDRSASSHFALDLRPASGLDRSDSEVAKAPVNGLRIGIAWLGWNTRSRTPRYERGQPGLGRCRCYSGETGALAGSQRHEPHWGDQRRAALPARSGRARSVRRRGDSRSSSSWLPPYS